MTAIVRGGSALAELRNREKLYAAAILASGRVEQLGAGDYYMARVRNNMLLPEPEWAVLKFILQSFPTDSTIVEIGCGWGQLLAMASTFGYSCIGIDVSDGRLEGAKYLRDLVEADFVGSAGRLIFFRGEFPSNWDTALERPSAKLRGPVVGFFSNLGLGRTEEFCEACVAEFRRFDYVIMDIVRFFADRLDLEAQNAFIEKMKRFGVRYQADIFHSPGAYRFIALSVGNAKPLQMQVEAENIGNEPLIDLFGSRVTPVRATVEVISEPSSTAGLERIIRIQEDTTTANSHDIRLTYSGKGAEGSFKLTAAFRGRERRAACIVLHCKWQDQIKIIVDIDGGTGVVELVAGDTFQLGSFGVRKNSAWTDLEATIDIRKQPKEVALSTQLVNEDGKYYYDGDGRSTIDVGVLRLAPV
jgi:hypothetical protein